MRRDPNILKQRLLSVRINISRAEAANSRKLQGDSLRASWYDPLFLEFRNDPSVKSKAYRMSMKAIDLYSGIGGWSAGLKAAGIDVVASFEIWQEAVETYNANLGSQRVATDVRELDLKSLPKGVDLVVGSPPCTEFSFSNRGGRGDLAEGLKDIVRFLEIVRYLRPKYWVLENVPRAAMLIELGLKTAGHPLYKFKTMKPRIEVLDFADFGLPQSRRRCLVGNIPFDRLLGYSEIEKKRTLGQVISCLSSKTRVFDPVWGGVFKKSSVSEMEPEPPLDAEQLRLNREAKSFHPVYNNMSFPDRLDRPSRTVTATCTRVSRESIVVSDSDDNTIRRLTVRERASLQGFPITYQFFGKSHSTKVKMIGNAVPPLISFFLGMASRDKSVKFTEMRLAEIRKTGLRLSSGVVSPITPPHSTLEKFPKNRRFRAAIPGLRFKSGMRFELSNEFHAGQVTWGLRFFYGPSKGFKTIGLNCALLTKIRQRAALKSIDVDITTVLSAIEVFIEGLSPNSVQETWTRRISQTGPFEIVDLLGLAAGEIANAMEFVDESAIHQIVLEICGISDSIEAPSALKLRRNSKQIIAGFLVGSFFNDRFQCGIQNSTASEPLHIPRLPAPSSKEPIDYARVVPSRSIKSRHVARG